MKQETTSRSIGTLLVGLATVGVITALIILTLGERLPGRAPGTQMGGSPTLGGTSPATGTSSITPGPSGTPTAAILTETASPSITPVIPPTGTSEDERVKYSGYKLGLEALNAWYGLVAGNTVTVFAGSLVGDPNQGALYLLFFYEPYANDVDEQILTPSKHGGVRVVSEQNNRLTLLSTDGTTYYFDVPSLRFVDSLDEVMPTATPPPTHTPIPPPVIHTPYP
jgi:hypothetical protein